jgi:hypothetical protein
MIFALLSSVCLVGLMCIAILMITRIISVDEAMKSIGRTLGILVLTLVAACLFQNLISAAIAHLQSFLRSLIHWAVVTVSVGALITLGLGAAFFTLQMASGRKR